MKPWVHFLVSLVLAIIFYKILEWKVLFIFIGGVLIDIDHYFWYAYKHKSLDFIHAYKHFSAQMKNHEFEENVGILLIFHTIEFLFAVVLLAFYSQYALAFAIGLIGHYIMDLIYLYAVPKRLITETSAIRWMIKNL